MLAAMDLATIDDLADVEAVLEQMGERPDAETDAAPTVRPSAEVAALVRMPRRSRSLDQRSDRAELEIAGKIVRTASASSGTTTSFLSTPR